jgi:hypothetical protein
MQQKGGLFNARASVKGTDNSSKWYPKTHTGQTKKAGRLDLPPKFLGSGGGIAALGNYAISISLIS